MRLRLRLGHVVFALIIASMLNLAIAWLCTYYAVPGYQGAILLSADEFDKGSGLVTERGHELVVSPWTAFGVTELDCLGPWYEWKPKVIFENRPTPKDCIDSLDRRIYLNTSDDNPLEQNGLRRQLLDTAYSFHIRIDAGWPMRSFRGFVSGGLQGPYKHILMPPLPKQLPLEEVSVIAMERSVSNTTLPRYLPYRPIWFGLIVNTLLFATVMIAIMWMMITARSKMRLHRNQCPKCKYPIGVSEVCTECGTDLVVQRIIAQTHRDRRPLPKLDV